MTALHRSLTSREARLGAGVLLALLALVGAGAATHSSLLLAPFAATAALKHAAPRGPLARPRNVIGGYLVGAAAGIVVGLLAPAGSIGPAVAAGIAAVAMARLDLDHPPAVAMAVIATAQPVPSVVQAAAAGAVVITASTVLLAPLLHRSAYPVGAADRVRERLAA